MSGYQRRPGATPLSRVRSLAIPDAPAFYERRSCLPQLDCERPHARDLDSPFFGIRPAFMCYVPSPVLASVGDTGERRGRRPRGRLQFPRHLWHLRCRKSSSIDPTMSTALTACQALGIQRRSPLLGAHSLVAGRPPPRQTVPVQDDDKFEDLEEANPFSFKEFLKTKNIGLSKEDPASRIYAKVGLDHNSPPSQTGGYGLEYQQPFFEDPTGASDLLDEEEDEDTGWSAAYLPSAIEQTHPERVRASTLPCSTYLSFFSTPSELAGPESLPPWALSDTDSRVSPASPAGSPSADFAAHGESLGDRHLRTLQISYEAAQVSNFQRENEALRCGQGASLTVVKQNADVALQNLRVVMNSSQASIKQLVSGAETLNLVAEILKSIDRISEIKDEEEDS
ncbi:PREDICTED: serologically defined colon cancer antigen 3 isoform X2 [Rhinopithecus bieti]|uniref:serologically defined colon cancer antigen 3 isoform X2 n=1 Tax=Rhinopithecus bieti TaxID=61621 RepID=UPI00083BC09A|nr:PREDICTED: serologically defined colon cancer antigen 3 isoform X2 [Rhinopithecus bieti]